MPSVELNTFDRETAEKQAGQVVQQTQNGHANEKQQGQLQNLNTDILSDTGRRVGTCNQGRHRMEGPRQRQSHRDDADRCHRPFQEQRTMASAQPYDATDRIADLSDQIDVAAKPGPDGSRFRRGRTRLLRIVDLQETAPASPNCF
jgi:hypothetical protein